MSQSNTGVLICNGNGARNPETAGLKPCKSTGGCRGVWPRALQLPCVGSRAYSVAHLLCLLTVVGPPAVTSMHKALRKRNALRRPQSNWEELGIEANRERRREAPIPLAIPVEITGFDTEGRFFSDPTKTVDISERGCSFRLRLRVDQPEQKPFLYQIARATADGDSWIVGAAKLRPESVWFVAFPHGENKAEARQQQTHAQEQGN